MKIQIQEQSNIIDTMNSLIDETLTINQSKIGEMQKANDELMQNYASEKETSRELQEQPNNMTKQFENEKEQFERDNKTLEKEINELKNLLDSTDIDNVEQNIPKPEKQLSLSDISQIQQQSKESEKEFQEYNENPKGDVQITQYNTEISKMKYQIQEHINLINNMKSLINDLFIIYQKKER